jgi:glutathione peroxidase-family protein
VLEFNGHEMFNESNLEWNGEKFIIGQELQKVFAPKVESKKNTDQFSKDETLIEEKSILTQELILGGMK